jgi:histidine triad (HIT) family protein
MDSLTAAPIREASVHFTASPEDNDVSGNSDNIECVFCRIVAKVGPTSLIYEDDKVVVFPVLQPVNPGHIIVVPKAHVPYLKNIDDDMAMHIIRIAKKMAQAISESSFKCEGINFFLADGESAGQEIFHLHFHVYPRFAGDGFGFKYDKEKHFIQIDQKQMNLVAEEIQKHIQ